jgi:triacylglycerol lipase
MSTFHETKILYDNIVCLTRMQMFLCLILLGLLILFFCLGYNTEKYSASPKGVSNILSSYGSELGTTTISQKCKLGRWILLPSLDPFYSGKDPKIYDTDLATCLLAIAFNVEISNCKNMGGEPPRMKDFDFQLPLIGRSFLGIPRMIAYIFYSTSRNIAIISFTGTFYADEWLEDLDVTQVAPTMLNNYKKGVLMHKGFYDIYTSGVVSTMKEIWFLMNKFAPAPKIFITGHSLGGAMASVCAYDLASFNPVIYTFASPRVFNPAGAGIFNAGIPASFRVFNTEDIFPTVPPPLSTGGTFYEHVNNGETFTDNADIIWLNHTYTYLKYFGLATGSWIPPV